MRIRLSVALALILAACSSGDSVQPGNTAPVGDLGTTTSEASATAPTTTVPASQVTQTTRPVPNPDRQLAPDFNLTLSDGTEYAFADEIRPVYLVFWAEW